MEPDFRKEAELRALIEKRVADLRPIFAWGAIGDFTRDVPMYEDQDDFTEVYLGVQIMLEVIRDQLNELTKVNTDLAQKVLELEREIRLRKDLEEQKDRFITTLGHELRNPLAAILYAARIIDAQKDADAVVQEEIAIINEQGARMSRLIRDLMDAARVARGKLELQMEAVDLTESTRHAVQAVQSIIEAKEQKFFLNLPKRPFIVFGDPLRLEQIIANLVTNAARYTDKGGKITVTLDEHGGRARLRVQDTGIGIPNEALERIFGAFVMSEASEGLGIGLAIARGLARMQGGDVRAESPGPGHGSEFTFYIPLMRAPAKSKANP